MQIHVVLPALVFTLLVAAAPLDEALHSRSSCAPVYVIFCRGTIEIPPLGTFVGPFFQAALVNLIPGVEVVGVTYPASIEGYLEGGDPIGTADMEALAEAYASDCPDGTIVLSGYRYGSLFPHKLGAETDNEKPRSAGYSQHSQCVRNRRITCNQPNWGRGINLIKEDIPLTSYTNNRGRLLGEIRSIPKPPTEYLLNTIARLET